MGIFKKRKVEISKIEKTELKQLNYDAKIILAWAKGIEGQNQFLVFLSENGYEELVMASQAIRLNDVARTWLMKNGYAHLMAFINAAEGIEKAQKWLLRNNFELLYHMAMCIEDDQESWEWLGKNASADLFLLTQTIKRVKDDIEENHNDVHSFRKDL